MTKKKATSHRDLADARAEKAALNVIWLPGRKQHRVRIGVNGRNKSFGYYTDLLVALRVRDLVYLRIGRELPDDSELLKLSDEEIDQLYIEYPLIDEALDETLDALDQPDNRTPRKRGANKAVAELTDSFNAYKRETDERIVTLENTISRLGDTLVLMQMEQESSEDQP